MFFCLEMYQIVGPEEDADHEERLDKFSKKSDVELDSSTFWNKRKLLHFNEDSNQELESRQKKTFEILLIATMG